MTLNSKLKKLEDILKSYNEIAVALSGGVDSAFLLAFACKTLGHEKVRALTASGPHLAADEIEYAKALCASLGVAHDIIDMAHIMPILAPNPADRCYHCKKAMFTDLKASVTSVLADGTNLDDMSDYRPGHKALAELQIASPLKEAGLTKSEIREALEMIAEDDTALTGALMLPDGSPIWEKPAFACLASRIPYGEEITEDKLTAVYKAESFLRSIGLKQVRVRHHGDIARIEVPVDERSKLFGEHLNGQSDEAPQIALDKINEEIKKCGFKYATLDLGGYKMGGGFHDGQETK